MADMNAKWIGLGLALATVFSGTVSAEEGWKELFNGKDLTGWVQRGGKAHYKVQDGVIVGSTVLNTPNSFLCTEAAYSDFVLDLEFKVNPALNSGVQIRSECFDTAKSLEHNGKTINIPAGRVHGYQVEIDMDTNRKRFYTGGVYDEGRRAWLFPGPAGGDAKVFSEQGGKVSKPEGWNKFRIECKGDSIKTWLNGELRADLKDGMTPKGFIALQVHGVGKDAAKENITVEFKNIRLKPL
jgi:hypothetical protein